MGIGTEYSPRFIATAGLHRLRNFSLSFYANKYRLQSDAKILSNDFQTSRILLHSFTIKHFLFN